MKNVLVTGGAGFIGSNFVRLLLSSGSDLRVVTLDALTYAGSLENLKDLPDPGRHTFVKGDICDRALVEDLLRTRRIDTLVHFAAETHVDRSILGPAPFIQTNVVGTFTLLEAVNHLWLGKERTFDGPVRFHHVSTDEVYGSLNPGDSPVSETAPYAPSSPYAASKAASDHLVRAYARTYDLPVTITNCSNNYGPYQFPEKLIPLTILNALEGKPIPVYGDGQQVRDWLYVEDHCRAIYRVLQAGRPGETYHVGGNNQPTNLAVVHAVCSILDERRPGRKHADQIQMVGDRPGHDRRYALDTRKIGDQLGWQPQHDLVAGLHETTDWYLNHPAWVEALRTGGDYQAWLERNYAHRWEEL